MITLTNVEKCKKEWKDIREEGILRFLRKQERVPSYRQTGLGME